MEAVSIGLERVDLFLFFCFFWVLYGGNWNLFTDEKEKKKKITSEKKQYISLNSKNHQLCAACVLMTSIPSEQFISYTAAVKAYGKTDNVPCFAVILKQFVFVRQLYYSERTLFTC